MYIHTYPEPICPTSHPLCPPSSAGSRSYSSPDFHRATRVSCRDKTLWANALFFFFFFRKWWWPVGFIGIKQFLRGEKINLCFCLYYLVQTFGFLGPCCWPFINTCRQKDPKSMYIDIYYIHVIYVYIYIQSCSCFCENCDVMDLFKATHFVGSWFGGEHNSFKDHETMR